MKIATWNVNSLNMRSQYLRIWLEKNGVDIIFLQETKTPDEKFPLSLFSDIGYKAYFYGQKSYNGVAILSLFDLDDVLRGFGSDSEEDEKRLITASYKNISFVSVYVPNGKEPDNPAFTKKIEFFDRLRTHLTGLRKKGNKVIAGGDFNVAIRNIDVWDPQNLDGSICFHPNEREKMKEILDAGFVDSFAYLNPEKKAFSWWDYRGGAFHKNEGMRLDYILVSDDISGYLTSCHIDRDSRKKAGELKPSDHSPVVVQIREL